MVKILKSKSKRIPARKRYKIERKVREHNRKLRKQKTQEKIGKKKKAKLIIVPGDCPFRNKILEEANQARANIEAAKVAKKEAKKQSIKERKEAKKAKKADAMEVATDETPGPSVTAAAAPVSIDDFVKRAEARGYVFEKRVAHKKQTVESVSDLKNHTKAFYKDLKNVIQQSDVVIEVLDARDPLGTRSEEVEDSIRASSGKRLIVVLNKSDLVPAENLQKWLKYLRAVCGTAVIPFKANTQKQKHNLGSAGKVAGNEGSGAWNTSKSVGVPELLATLGNWAKNSPGGIIVGVVGMPNVGKSSVINSLKRSRACTVGAKEGVTRSCQTVVIDSHLKLIDSPGVYVSDDQVVSVKRILESVPKDVLILHYSIPTFESEDEFLAQVAIKYNIVKTGGVPNLESAQLKVVSDWHSGSIKYFTEPPQGPEQDASDAVTLVSTLAKPFDPNQVAESATVPDEDAEMQTSDLEDDDDDNDYEDVEDGGKGSKKVRFAIDSNKPARKQRDSATESVNRITRKSIAKKMRKSKKKSLKKADELSAAVENFNFA